MVINSFHIFYSKTLLSYVLPQGNTCLNHLLPFPFKDFLYECQENLENMVKLCIILYHVFVSVSENILIEFDPDFIICC